MKRTVSLERIYNIGNFQSIRFGDIIEDIPEDLAFNPKVIAALRMVQIIHTEKAYFTYMKKKAIVHELGVEDALALLEEASHVSIKNLKDIIDNKQDEE